MSRPRRQENSAPPGIEQIEETVRREVAAMAAASLPGSTAALWRAMCRRAADSATRGLWAPARARLEHVAHTALHHLRRWRGR